MSECIYACMFIQLIIIAIATQTISYATIQIAMYSYLAEQLMFVISARIKPHLFQLLYLTGHSPLFDYYCTHVMNHFLVCMTALLRQPATSCSVKLLQKVSFNRRICTVNPPTFTLCEFHEKQLEKESSSYIEGEQFCQLEVHVAIQLYAYSSVRSYSYVASQLANI